MNEDARVSTAATGSTRNIPRILAALGILMLLGGCSAFGVFSAPQTLHGNRVDQYRLAELVPGTSTQADVTALVDIRPQHVALYIRGHPDPYRAHSGRGRPGRRRVRLR